MDTYFLKIVPEKVIKESAEIATEMGESDNSFSHLLLTADKYKQAEMTPIFLLDEENMEIYCVAKETFKKKLH